MPLITHVTNRCGTESQLSTSLHLSFTTPAIHVHNMWHLSFFHIIVILFSGNGKNRNPGQWLHATFCIMFNIECTDYCNYAWFDYVILSAQNASTSKATALIKGTISYTAQYAPGWYWLDKDSLCKRTITLILIYTNTYKETFVSWSLLWWYCK